MKCSTIIRLALFCIHDLVSVPTQRAITTNVIYIHFHRPAGKYAGNYPDTTLKEWAGWLKDQQKKTKSVFAYFNNDIYACAVNNAKKLRQFVSL